MPRSMVKLPVLFLSALLSLHLNGFTASLRGSTNILVAGLCVYQQLFPYNRFLEWTFQVILLL